MDKEEASDSDPLTFDEGFEGCVYSQDEPDDDGKEASRGAGVTGRKKSKPAHHLLRNWKVEDFMEKYPSCFSLDYPEDVFEGIEQTGPYYWVASEDKKEEVQHPSNLSSSRIIQRNVNQGVASIDSEAPTIRQAYGCASIPYPTPATATGAKPKRGVLTECKLQNASQLASVPGIGADPREIMVQNGCLTTKPSQTQVPFESSYSSQCEENLDCQCTERTTWGECSCICVHDDEYYSEICVPNETYTSSSSLTYQRNSSGGSKMRVAKKLRPNEGTDDSMESDDSQNSWTKESDLFLLQENSVDHNRKAISSSSFNWPWVESCESNNSWDTHMKGKSSDNTSTESSLEPEKDVTCNNITDELNSMASRNGETSREEKFLRKAGLHLLNKVRKNRRLSTPEKQHSHFFQQQESGQKNAHTPRTHALFLREIGTCDGQARGQSNVERNIASPPLVPPKVVEGRFTLSPSTHTQSHGSNASSSSLQTSATRSNTSSLPFSSSAKPFSSSRSNHLSLIPRKVLLATSSHPPLVPSKHSPAATTPSPPLLKETSSALTPAFVKLSTTATRHRSPSSSPPAPQPQPLTKQHDGERIHHYQAIDKWHITIMNENDSAQESADSTVVPSWKSSSKENLNSNYTNDFPFGSLKQAWRKTARRSLDWQLTSSATSTDNSDSNSVAKWKLIKQNNEVKQARRSLDCMPSKYTNSGTSGDEGASEDAGLNNHTKEVSEGLRKWQSASTHNKVSEDPLNWRSRPTHTKVSEEPLSWRSIPTHAKLEQSEDALNWPSASSHAKVSEDTLNWRAAPKQSKETRPARRSLDWMISKYITKENDDTGIVTDRGIGTHSKGVDEGPLSWRTAPRASADWPLTQPTLNSFLKRVKAETDFDIKALQQTSFSPGFIDTHCHLDFLYDRIRHRGSYALYQSTTSDPFPVSYEGCITIFCKPWTFEKVSWWSEIISESQVWAAFGCHPHFADSFQDSEETYLEIALYHNKTLALGEIGLDYFKKNPDDFVIQRTVFRKQLKFALSVKKPVIIHCRDAHRDCIDIMKEILPLDYKIHLHCFTDTWQQAEEWLDTFSNLFIGITNLINIQRDSRTNSLLWAVKNIPLNRLLLETDTPYFRPPFVQEDGQYSNPGMALFVAAQIAHLKGEEVQKVLTHVRQNTRAMYGI